MRPTKCTSPAGSKARAAIRRVATVDDLRVLESFCRARREELVKAERASVAEATWDALVEGVYVLGDGVITHPVLLVGAHYRVVPHRGRKHRGAHCYRVGTHDKPLWLDWYQAARLVPVSDGARENAERVEEAREFRRVTKRLFEGVATAAGRG